MPYLYVNLNNMNWLILIIPGVLAMALIIFLVRQNLKDKRSLTNQLNRNYRKSKDQEGDVELEDVPK
jgi:hypothetical protein